MNEVLYLPNSIICDENSLNLNDNSNFCNPYIYLIVDGSVTVYLEN
jgi:hypothetical protein